MEIRPLAIVVVWLSLGLFVGSEKVTSMDKTNKGKSTTNVQNIVTTTIQVHQRQSNPRTYSKQRLAREKHDSKMTFKKKYAFKLNSRKNINLSNKVIARSKSKHSFLKKERENKVYQRRRDIPDYRKASLPFHLDSEATGRDEDGLLKRSRNRVRLKTQRSHYRDMDSTNDWTTKQDIIALKSKGAKNANMSKETKRQRILGGITYSDTPSKLINGNTGEIPDEGLPIAENPDSFFANPMAARPEQRVLHSSHFYAPAVHKFLPAEHRYSGAPIHRYLSSPVIFKNSNREGYPTLDSRAVSGPAGPFGDAPMPPLLQGPPHHGDRVIIINRPIHTPVPVPVHGPPRIAVIHHPVPLPPQQVPVPVMVPRPRPPQFVVVHHREFSGPGEF